jgi:hypothetical protein
MPPTLNGFDIQSDNKPAKNTVKSNFLGFLHNNANSVQFNGQYVGLYTMPFASSHGVSFNKEGFWESIMMFNARKLIKLNWLNDKDEYLAPNVNHKKYEVFKNLSLVRSIFSEGSNQTSWLNKTYKGISYRIKNEFFPFKKTQISEVINQHPTMSTFDDFNSSGERYVAEVLWDEKMYDELPEIAKRILQEYKQIYSNRIGEMADSTWDVGYIQIRKSFPNDFNLFDEHLKELDSVMRPLVYELGFLKN